ncbi:nitrate/sulfonate/bicarbonate ABC transporter ATP-binding protein [Parvibaculum sp.]|uniref:ABC transporter ATP-binding protein n=1 Tax=Parvibaculum sp. TaxID=2024848 RepID=UPI002CC8C7D7|nr:nitrate/sulfonate/bicarbonate ABC transporter ATP-binding protein [Parvibaculum sp.]HUD50424.1 nitrate/sulfonate/bicarbonate ABC transporter ATP-binding protein [Parvibaculum sp.]
MATTLQTKNVLEVKDVRKAFPRPSGGELTVLDDVDMTLKEGEIVGLLGRSGSGKSTLLRIMAGLIEPTGGEARFLGAPIDGPAEGIAMVFQTFALFPWLTVLQNVQLGLDALQIPKEEAHKRALEAIDLVGLDGFESAYPKELSGGMRQRVGFARALVVHPDLLLMDEPFSALDVLTAETLRTDLLDLWSEGRMPIKSILLVTHNIEEAVLMCDRILLFSSNPGRVIAEIPVDIQRPRNRLDPKFRWLVDSIYERMTMPAKAQATGAMPAFSGGGIDMILPRVSTNSIAGLIEAVAGAPYHGKADLPQVAEHMRMTTDALFSIGETLQLLRFAEIEGGDIRLTEAGTRFANEGPNERKQMFAERLLTHVPLAAHIKRVLDERPAHRAPYARFAEELEDAMSEEWAEQTLRSVINWGRFAEVFAYDENQAMLSLDNPS